MSVPVMTGVACIYMKRGLRSKESKPAQDSLSLVQRVFSCQFSGLRRVAAVFSMAIAGNWRRRQKTMKLNQDARVDCGQPYLTPFIQSR